MKALIAGAAVAAAVSAGAVSDVPAAKVLQPTAAYAAETVFSQNNGASGFLPGRYDVQAMAPAMFNWSRESRFAGNTDGTLKWQNDIRTTPQNGAGAVIDGDGTVYLHSRDGEMKAFNPDGSVKWVTGNLGKHIRNLLYLGPTALSIWHPMTKRFILLTKKREKF